MRKIITLSVAVILLTIGCNKDESPTMSLETDQHPTSILSFQSNGYSFNTDKAVAIISIGDTIWHEIVAVDKDHLVSYQIMHAGKDGGTVSPYGMVDTLTARFGFIADTSYVKPGGVVTESVIFKDGLGFTKKLDIDVYIKP
jgi:hypothetical protein